MEYNYFKEKNKNKKNNIEIIGYILYNFVMINIYNFSNILIISIIFNLSGNIVLIEGSMRGIIGLISFILCGFNNNNNIKLEIGISIYEMILNILLIILTFFINIYIIKYKIINLIIGISLIIILINIYNNRIEATKSGLKAVTKGLAVVILLLGGISCLMSIIISLLVVHVLGISSTIGSVNYINTWASGKGHKGTIRFSALLHSATLITAGIILCFCFGGFTGLLLIRDVFIGSNIFIYINNMYSEILLLYTNINIMHHISLIDPFSFLLLLSQGYSLGILLYLCYLIYFNYNNWYIITCGRGYSICEKIIIIINFNIYLINISEISLLLLSLIGLLYDILFYNIFILILL